MLAVHAAQLINIGDDDIDADDRTNLKREDLADVSQSLTRARFAKFAPFFNTLLPISKVVMMRKPRLLYGIEALGVQGMHHRWLLTQGFSWELLVHQFKNRQLFDLAGNAFDAGSVMFTMLASVLLCERRPVPLVASPSTGPRDADTGSDADNELSSTSDDGCPNLGKRFRALESLAST